VVREVAPGRTLKGREPANFVRDGATTYFPSSGACRMDNDDAAVVDSQLRVNGVRNLRIADSTIMPRIVAVPTMPACVFIGLRVAELLGQGAPRRREGRASRLSPRQLPPPVSWPQQVPFPRPKHPSRWSEEPEETEAAAATVRLPTRLSTGIRELAACRGQAT